MVYGVCTQVMARQHKVCFKVWAVFSEIRNVTLILDGRLGEYKVTNSREERSKINVSVQRKERF